MKFYDREQELARLRDVERLSRSVSQFTVVLGRRRVGKTTLMLKGAEGTRSVYLFISKLEESILCERLQATARESGVDIPGRMESFRDLLKALMMYSSVVEPITVIIDEFQNLDDVNPAVFGDIQEVWDTYSGKARINLVVGGSVHSMMTRIFEDGREPLFERPTCKLEVRPFRTSVLKTILRDHNPGCTDHDLLTLYMLTGGVPEYVSLLMDAGATDSDSMLRFALSQGSRFLREGEDLLTSEMGGRSRVYLSVLQLIASGKTKRSEMEDVLGTSLGEYLQRMDEEYGFIRRRVPMITGDRRLGRWEIRDRYLDFYLTFIQPNRSLMEAGRSDLLERAVRRSLESYEGRVLEEYHRTRIAEEWTYTGIGSYWNRRGDVEIDIVVVDSVNRTMDLIEVKRNPEKIDLEDLRRKADTLSENTKGFEVRLSGLSMRDM